MKNIKDIIEIVLATKEVICEMEAQDENMTESSPEERRAFARLLLEAEEIGGEQFGKRNTSNPTLEALINAERENRELQKQLDNLEEEKSELDFLYDSAKSDYMNLMDEHETMSTQFDDESHRLMVALGERDDAKEECEALEEQSITLKKRIKELERKIEDMQRKSEVWVSPSECKPPVGVWVFITAQTGNVMQAKLTENGWIRKISGNAIKEPLAWMSIPERKPKVR